MRIIIFSELFFPSIGGQEVRFKELGGILVARGHEVIVCTIGHEHGLASSEDLDGVKVVRFPLDATYIRPFRGFLPRNPMTIIRYAYWTRGVAARFNPDLAIYNQWPFVHVLLAPRSIRRCAVIDWCEIRHGWLYRIAQAWLPRLVSLNIGVSREVCTEVERAAGRRALYIPSGVTIAKYKQEDPEKRAGILYLGRITQHKDLPLLISSYEYLCERGYRGSLTVAGSGPDLDVIRERAAASPCNKRIRVVGEVDEGTKVELLGRAELLVLTSRREGFPRVVAEAMASGTPVVTVDHPENGTKAVVEEYGIGVVTSPSISALARGIMSALSEWPKYSVAGRKAGKRLDWSGLADLLLKECAAMARN